MALLLRLVRLGNAARLPQGPPSRVPYVSALLPLYEAEEARLTAVGSSMGLLRSLVDATPTRNTPPKAAQGDASLAPAHPRRAAEEDVVLSIPAFAGVGWGCSRGGGLQREPLLPRRVAAGPRCGTPRGSSGPPGREGLQRVRFLPRGRASVLRRGGSYLSW
jgi:hypothetical protein